MSADAVERRYRVLELRIQLERAAVAAHRAVCRSAPAAQKDIRGKLLFLVGLVEPARRAEVHRLARLAGHVYARTSDVLHARASAPDVPDAVVDEWSTVVGDVVAVVSRAEQAPFVPGRGRAARVFRRCSPRGSAGAQRDRLRAGRPGPRRAGRVGAGAGGGAALGHRACRGARCPQALRRGRARAAGPGAPRRDCDHGGLDRSNADLFPLDPLPAPGAPLRAPDPGYTEERLAIGWRELGLPRRWVPRPVDDACTAFAARFGRAPRPVQVAAIDAALGQDQPGMVVVEAPMGEGKTEAALLAAEAWLPGPARMAALSLFPRGPRRMPCSVASWPGLGMPGIPVGDSVMLAHGTASLNALYRGLSRSGPVRGIGRVTTRPASRTSCLRGRRRGLCRSSSSAPSTRCCSPR